MFWSLLCKSEKTNSEWICYVVGDYMWNHKDFPKIVPKARRTFPNIFRELLTISEDFRRLPKTFEEDLKRFRLHTNEFKYNLKDKLDIIEIIDIFTCEDIVSFLSICYHSAPQIHQFTACNYKWYVPIEQELPTTLVRLTRKAPVTT